MLSEIKNNLCFQMPFSATVIVVIKLNSYWLGTLQLLPL